MDSTLDQFKTTNDKWICSSIRSVLAWKTELTKQLLTIETTSNVLTEMIGQTSSKVLLTEGVQNEIVNEGLDPDETIRYHILKSQCATYATCNLIRLGSDLEKPIPGIIIVRVASRLCDIRPKEYLRSNFSLEKKTVYANSVTFAHLYLDIIEALVHVGQTNMIRWISYINHDIMDMLKWTKSSGLVSQSESNYMHLKCRLYDTIVLILATLGSNSHFEKDLLHELILDHLICDSQLKDEIDPINRAVQQNKNSQSSLNNDLLEHHSSQVKLTCKSLSCMEAIINYYSLDLDLSVLAKVKEFTVYLCLDIYRDLKSIKLPYDTVPCRYHSLSLLMALVNEIPVQGTITELATHIFVRALKFESDVNIRKLCYTATHVATRRPILVLSDDITVRQNGDSNDEIVRALNSDGIAKARNSDDIVEVRDSDETVKAQNSDEIVKTRDSDEIVEVRVSDEMVKARDSDEIVIARDSDSDSEIEVIMRSFVDKPADAI